MEETDTVETPHVRPVPHHCRRSWFQKHIWGKWETVREGKITSGGNAIGYYMEQKRTCICCGKIQLITEETK